MSPSKSSSKARPTTRSKNATTHPGDAVPKQVKRTKAELDAAKEALKLVKKKKEVERKMKLTNVAQAADNIVHETQAQEALVPCTRPKHPLKRTYAMLDVTATDNDEIQLATSDTGECSDVYVPSEHPTSEPIDPASDSADSHTASVEPPKKKRGRPSKKASVLDEIQLH